MYPQEFSHAQNLFITKVSKFGTVSSGHHQTCIPKPMRKLHKLSVNFGESDLFHDRSDDGPKLVIL